MHVMGNRSLKWRDLQRSMVDACVMMSVFMMGHLLSDFTDSSQYLDSNAVCDTQHRFMFSIVMSVVLSLYSMFRVLPSRVLRSLMWWRPPTKLHTE